MDTNERAPSRGLTRSVTWLAQLEPSELVKNFISNEYYFDHYYNLAKHAADLTKEKLAAEKGKPDGERLHANIRFRAKEPDSLREKLIMRDQTEHYDSSEAIKKDIHDFAGVRMILYMPSEPQRGKADAMIRDIFGQDIKKRLHEGLRPAELQDESQGQKKYKPKHLGYEAVHYRAPMKEEYSVRDGYHFIPGDKVEIQVVSALSHAWAEAGHDVKYKSYAYGPPTFQEERVLDALNGLVQSGDLLLEQFHDMVLKRTFTRFAHVHDFGIYLDNLDLLVSSEETRKFEEGPLDVLLEFLRLQDKDYPLAVRNAVKELGFSDEPKLDDVVATFQPPFKPDDSMTATLCLIYRMLPQLTDDKKTESAPGRRCRVMMNALTLLQDFAGQGEAANRFLREKVEMTDEVKQSLNFVLTSTRRQAALSADYEDDQQKIKSDLHAAWNWFQDQAHDRTSICGLVFRLAVMGVIKDKTLKASLDQLDIGPLSRTSTGWESDTDHK